MFMGANERGRWDKKTMKIEANRQYSEHMWYGGLEASGALELLALALTFSSKADKKVPNFLDAYILGA
jgi:hypothetical protein